MLEDNSPIRDPRISNLDVVQVWDEKTGRFDSAHTDNISRSGLFIITDDPLPVGSKVRIKFTLVCGETPSGEVELKSLDVWTEVVRAIFVQDVEPGLQAGMGVRFVDPPPEISELIDEIIVTGLEYTKPGL